VRISRIRKFDELTLQVALKAQEDACVNFAAYSIPFKCILWVTMPHPRTFSIVMHRVVFQSLIT